MDISNKIVIFPPIFSRYFDANHPGPRPPTPIYLFGVINCDVGFHELEILEGKAKFNLNPIHNHPPTSVNQLCFVD